MQMAAMNPSVRVAGRDPGRRAREGEGDPDREGQAVGQARGGDPEDRRRPDREVGEGDLPARSGLGEGPEGKKDIRSLLTELDRQDRREHQVRRFVRFELGEGLEKRADDFAAEVEKQAGQA